MSVRAVCAVAFVLLASSASGGEPSARHLASGELPARGSDPGATAAAPEASDWLLRDAGAPTGRRLAAVAYDSARDRLVLFGGYAGTALWLSDTWEWDGRSWIQRNASPNPGPRYAHAMAYDSARGRVVLFGGYYNTSNLADTWEWDGSTWTPRTPAVSPPARHYHAMAYDSARGRVVLFGGYDYGWRSDTWEWDGTNWVQRTPATSPPARYAHAMTYDAARARVVLFGGYTGAPPYFGDTWEWDGNAWVQRAPQQSPSARYAHAMAYDSTRSRVVVFGGFDGALQSDAWEWDGSGWARRAQDSSPPARYQLGMAFDSLRSRTVLFGGAALGVPYLSDTWEWDGSSWTRRNPAASPTGRYGHAMVFDAARGRTLLFGGNDGTSRLSDTWEWDGNTWLLRTPPTSPTPRYLHRMAYDSARGRVVLFGGSDGTNFLSDTWEWDGSTWAERTPASSPSPRYLYGMAYDAGTNSVVLFGGYDGQDTLGDTWEWDGANWIQRAPAKSPRGRSAQGMAYDSRRGRVLMFGGFYADSAFDDTWEWDGSTWIERSPSATPPARYLSGMEYDDARGRMVLFGGYGLGRLSDTFEYGTIEACASAAAVINFTPGGGTGDTTADAALGPPDGSAVSLGTNGSLVVRLEKPVENGPGADLIVYETADNALDYPENFRVEGSGDGVGFVFLRDCPGGECQLDLTEAGLAEVSYLRITDLPPQEPAPIFTKSGADIDAVAAIYCKVPVELCNGLDDDGDGVIPSNEIDHDGDGYVACSSWVGSDPAIRGGGDCDDANAAVHPGASETCNGLDDDCDGVIDNDGPALCDDGNICTDDACGGSAGCAHVGNTSPCDDGNVCTTNDACSGGTCVGGPPLDCDDGDCCTVDTCDPATGCIHGANKAPPVFTTQPSLGDAVLWPPEHGYADFALAATGAVASSACGISSLAFDGCVSSQPEDATGVGDGNTVRDCVYEPAALHLRAERDGSCSPVGRVYTSWLMAVDACGNTARSAPFTVGVGGDHGHPPSTGTIIHAAPGSGTRDVRSGANGSYGDGCGTGAAAVPK